MMIARHTGYKPGVFTHIVANEQIYDRHIDAAMEMKKRFKEKVELEFCANEWEIRIPELALNPNKTNFYDFTVDDFMMVDY